MPVMYANNKIIPAPTVDISEQVNRNADLGIMGNTYTITLHGTLVAWKGSPDSSGVFWDQSAYPPDENITGDSRLRSILNKQAALRKLFSSEGQWLEIQPYDGTKPTKFQPRVIGIEFPEGIWYDRCEYTITLETDILNTIAESGSTFQYKISDAQDEWTIELNEQAECIDVPYTYRVTHNVSAVGRPIYKPNGQLELPAWQQARKWVQTRLSTDVPLSKLGYGDASPGQGENSGVMAIDPIYKSRNHLRAESINVGGGTYSIQESWVMASGNSMETFSVSTELGQSDGLTHVTIDGRVEGLVEHNDKFLIKNSKWVNASGKFGDVIAVVYDRAKFYSGVNLNRIEVSKVIGKDPINGIINYNYQYNDRPTNFIANARMENITITDNLPTDVFASIPVLGRQKGPVLQKINTFTARQRQLAIEAIIVPSGIMLSNFAKYGYDSTKPDTQPIVDAASGALPYTQIFKDQDQESWNPKTGVYQRQVSWTWEL